MKKSLQFAVKIIFSAALLWIVFSRIDLSAMAETMRSVQWIWLFWAFMLQHVGKFLTGTRWQKILRSQGVSISLRQLVASLYVAQFFNAFLPSTIGGDTIRIYDTIQYSQKKTKPITAVFLDRLLGLFALVMLGLAALAVGLLLKENLEPFVWLIIGSFLACTAVLLIIFNRSLAQKAGWLLNRLKLTKAAAKVSKASTAILALKSKKLALLQVFLISIVLQVNVIIFYYFISQALHLQISILYFFVVIPIILIILLLPISINGIGLREGAYIFFFSRLGAADEVAISLSLLAFGLTLIQGIIGGIIFALRGISPENRRQITSLLKREEAT